MARLIVPRRYGTERAVGKAIKQSGIPREEIFLTTKLWNNSHHPDDVEKAMDASLKNLQVDFVDLYLMHWPSAFARSDKLMPKGEDGKIKTGDTDYVDTWKAMEKLVKAGKAKAIGISNFSKAEIDRLLAEATIVSAVGPEVSKAKTVTGACCSSSRAPPVSYSRDMGSPELVDIAADTFNKKILLPITPPRASISRNTVRLATRTQYTPEAKTWAS